MAKLPTNTIIAWPHTAAIPAGFSWWGSGKGRYLQPTGASGGRTTGGDTHTHSEDGSHTHTLAAHYHYLVVVGAATGGEFAGFESVYIPHALVNHLHAVSLSTAGGGTDVNSNADTYTAVAEAWDPPYMYASWITPDDASQGIPDDAVVWGDGSIAYGGGGQLSLADGTGDAVDLDGLWIKGATQLSDGGTIGGPHLHNYVSECEVATPAHSHGGSFGVTATLDSGRITSGPATIIHDGAVHHSVATCADNDEEYANATGYGTDATATEPEWVKLLALQNLTGGSVDPTEGTIVGYTGTGDAPDGWEWCDGVDDRPDVTARQVKCTVTQGDVGTTGGATSHVHTATEQHRHMGAAHDHTVTAATGGTGFNYYHRTGDGGNNMTDTTHTHSGYTCTTIYGQDTTFATGYTVPNGTDSSDVLAPYQEIGFIVFQPPPPSVTVHIQGGAIQGAAIAA